MRKKLEAIPTNIITGFLGVGKTSAILHLLKQKPADETWAVLVNEYGAMGIDADILADKGAFVEQVPGGCICCAQGLPFEVALNRLIKTARPHRLIIEPSGLAHPYRIIKQLNKGYFKPLLSVQAIICLVDALHLLDDRYTTNEMFIDQIALADVLLANKNDLASDEASQLFRKWAARSKPEKIVVSEICHGEIQLNYLNLARNTLRKPEFPDSHTSNSQYTNIETWCKEYSSETQFDLEELLAYFQQLTPIRLKAILNTDNGWYVFNQVGKELTYYKTKARSVNRIEVLGCKKPLTLEIFQLN